MAEKDSSLPIQKLIDGIKAEFSQKKGADGQAPWIKYVALLTGVLAALAGFLAVRSTSLTNDAIYESNQAIMAQAQASDNWSEYQADSIKARIIETQLIASAAMNGHARSNLSADAKEMRDRQPALKQTATQKEQEREAYLKEGMKHLQEKDLLGYASLALQLGIALASVAALARMRIALVAGIFVGGAGIAITIYAFAGHYGINL